MQGFEIAEMTMGREVNFHPWFDVYYFEVVTPRKIL